MREMCVTEPAMIEQLRRHTSTLIAALKNLVLSGYAPEHDVHGIVDPFLQASARARECRRPRRRQHAIPTRTPATTSITTPHPTPTAPRPKGDTTSQETKKHQSTLHPTVPDPTSPP
eukprot:6177684-Pleurochrysis_carterae.AAC.7